MQIPLSLSATQDKLIWIHDRNERFSVKSCYRLLQTDFNDVPTDENFLWKKIWSLKVPHKVRVHVWRICRGIVPTVEALRERHVAIPPKFSFV